jgi:hypothetical protein
MIMDKYYIGDLARPAVMWMRLNPAPLESSPTESVSAAINAIVSMNSPITDRGDFHIDAMTGQDERKTIIDR